jgi:hypothetical protein
MTFKSKIYFTLFIILESVGLVLLLGLLAVKSLPASDNLTGQDLFLPVSAAERDRVALISFFGPSLNTEGQRCISMAQKGV